MLQPFASRLVRFIPLLLLLAASSLPLLADITFGGSARSVGMGGAGLASGDSSDAATLNPAFLADSGFRFGIEMPSLSTRLDGASYSDAISLLTDPSLDGDAALDYAIELGSSDKRIETAATAGVLLPHMDLRLNAAIRTEIKPNDSFKAWAQAGGSGVPPLDARADVYAGGIANLPSAGIGLRVPMKSIVGGDVRVGVRVKPTKAYYSHYIVDSAAVVADDPRLADEMGGKEYISDSSLCADLGILYSPADRPDLRLAFVVNNLIEPKELDFAAAAPDGMFTAQLAPRSYSAGVAYVQDLITLALDAVDITQSYGDRQYRAGAELRLPLVGVALRGGYNNVYGFSAGIGVGGFGIAISENTPFMLSQSVAF